MGGGSSYSSNLRSTSLLESKARQKIRDAQSGMKNVFISFATEDMDEVNLLRASAKNEKSPIEFKDYSIKEAIDSKRADYIKQVIREKIDQCSTTVVYLSASAATSPWVDWEIRKSIELGKRVIAVHKGDVAPRTLPTVVKECGIKVVAWKNLSAEL